MMVKDRLLVLLQILQEHTDDETWMTTAEILGRMSKEGQDGCIRTLRRNIASLQNCGYKIGIRETNGGPTEYAYLGRKWVMPELRILVDAVAAAQFLSQSRSKKLIAKLSEMAGPSHTDELKPRILISENVKAKNEYMLYTVDAIRKAIDRNRKITFRYLQYDEHKEQHPKHAGTDDEWYVISPYATVWNNDRYYLVGWSDKREKVVTFRIDRIQEAKQLPNKRVPAPEDFDIRDYTEKVFRMYSGPEEKVTLRCSLGIMDQVIDRFGESVEVKNLEVKTVKGKKTGYFTITVPVNLSTTFYSWVFTYVGQMKILGPEKVRKEYEGYLKQAMNEMAEE
jgi:predicted DNA-binding transcriptional regulator YafY